MPIVVGFAITLAGAIAAIWFNIRLLKRRLGRWSGNLTVLFVFSVGSVDPAKRELWTARDFDADSADLIVKQQLACLLEIPIGFVIGAVVSGALVLQHH